MGGEHRETGPFRCTLQVRWADFDQMGHVNNVKYLEYAQEARVLFARTRLGPLGLGNLPQVVRRNEIDHLRPVLRDSTTVDVQIEVENVGNTSFTLRHTIFDSSGDTCCVVLAVMVTVDLASGSAVELSAPVRKVLHASNRAALDGPGAHR